jgi:hypothetical protein
MTHSPFTLIGRVVEPFGLKVVNGWLKPYNRGCRWLRLDENHRIIVEFSSDPNEAFSHIIVAAGQDTPGAFMASEAFTVTPAPEKFSVESLQKWANDNASALEALGNYLAQITSKL